MGPAVIEPIAARGWRARERAKLGGWRLYASSGITGRINTCWTLAEPGLPMDAAIAKVEAWYAERGFPPRFKLTEGCAYPVELAQRLAERGYAPSVATLTMTGPLTAAGDAEVAVSAELTPGFREVFSHGVFGDEGDAAERLEALARIPRPRGFALIRTEASPAAIGACAVEGEWAGLMAMRTSPDHRRLGLARRVFRALCAFGREAGASRGYLQVEEDNVSAVRLYESEGFANQYAYRYWQKP